MFKSKKCLDQIGCLDNRSNILIFFIFNPTFFPSPSNYLPKSFNKVEIKDTNWLKEGYFVY